MSRLGAVNGDDFSFPPHVDCDGFVSTSQNFEWAIVRRSKGRAISDLQET